MKTQQQSHAEASEKNSPRKTWSEALRLNMSETSLATLYGTIGIAVKEEIPLFGRINFPLAAFIAILPGISRYLQTKKILENASSEEKTIFYKEIFANVLVSCAMTFITYAATAAYGSTVGFALLGSWLISKFISGGDHSPLHFVEAGIAGKEIEGATHGRETLLQSLSRNMTDTVRIGWYAFVALATTSGAPLIGQISPGAAFALIATPIVTCFNLINKVEANHPEARNYPYRNEVLTETAMNAGVAAAIYILGNVASPIVSQFAIAGTLASQLVNGGKGSPMSQLKDGIIGKHTEQVIMQREKQKEEQKELHME